VGDNTSPIFKQLPPVDNPVEEIPEPNFKGKTNVYMALAFFDYDGDDDQDMFVGTPAGLILLQENVGPSSYFEQPSDEGKPFRGVKLASWNQRIYAKPVRSCA